MDNLDELAEEELARRAQAGSAACFGVLAQRYRERLVRYLGSRMARPQDAEDLVQDAFAKAYANIQAFQVGRPFANWLFTVAVRLACSHGRKLRREVSLDEGQAVDESAADPQRLVAAAQQRENLWTTARRVLTDNQYQALWLRYAQDLPIRGVAAAMKTNGLHVRVLLHRARKALLKCPSFVRTQGPA